MEVTYKYRFSIVMAVYNVENYLEEAINSVISQDIGFEEHVQLILVDDGSTDLSGSICKNYTNLYPNNIIYINKPNGGVSTARNKGMEYVEGKYMNFLDSDDILDADVLSRVYNLFEQIYNYTDVVSVPIYFFEGAQGAHILNYKYRKTRQANLIRDYQYIQLSSSAAFVKSEFKDLYQFDTDMKYAEDALFINKILLHKETMGVLKGSGYRYRRRQTGTSAIQVGTKVKEWYTEYLRTFSISLIKYAKAQKGYIPKFIQYTIMHDLQWRLQLKDINANVLNEIEKQEFIACIQEILQEVNDEIILEQRSLSIAHKLFALKLKNGNEASEQLRLIESPKNIELMYGDQYVYSLSEDKAKIDFVDIIDNQLYIEGCLGKTLDFEDYEVYIEFNETKYLAECVDRSINNEESLGNLIKKTIGFKMQIPLEKDIKVQSVRVFIKVKESWIRPQLMLGKFVRINKDVEDSYFITKTHRVVFKYNTFYLIKNSLKVNIGREFRVCKSLLKKRQYA
ncbi:glycosyltransferase family 2 protein [Cellulosilyticum ruminicola]|uniref:glycosyltransferase family 2 protein n=1 Tax=Cellulosilyticum ruminicola TaxID=425254 RepID=UPI0006D0CA58|nr:glycosyltransferase family 2 protein [Cellulosilyticum ruminicola]